MNAIKLIKDNTGPWNKKSIVFIHGIGDQIEAYADQLADSLRNQDIATADAARWYSIRYAQINDAMSAKLRLIEQDVPSSSDSPAFSAETAEYLIDIVNYIGMNDLHNWINNFCRAALVEVVRRGQDDGVHQYDHEIYLIAHSLGTVVSYETLHDIADDAQVLGLAKRFRIKSLFTMGSPLAFIKKQQSRIPGFFDSHLKEKPIGRPTKINAATGLTQTNVLDWYNFRHSLDPVASLTPLDQASANGSLSRETFVFKEFHTGVNPHDFKNYIIEFGPLLMEKIRG